MRSRELLDNLFHLVRNVQLQVIDGNKVIEIRVTGIDKGAAAKKILSDGNFDFIMAIGDDKTDEDMFRSPNGEHKRLPDVNADPTTRLGEWSGMEWKVEEETTWGKTKENFALGRDAGNNLGQVV